VEEKKSRRQQAGWNLLESGPSTAQCRDKRATSHVPHYRATKSKFYAASFLGCLETQYLKKRFVTCMGNFKYGGKTLKYGGKKLKDGGKKNSNLPEYNSLMVYRMSTLACHA
jgi:hypothetical protein